MPEFQIPAYRISHVEDGCVVVDEVAAHRVDTDGPMGQPPMIIFDADDLLVLDGTYDREGYKPGERARIAKARAAQTKGPRPMGFKLFDVKKIGLTCDTITHTTEKRQDGEIKVIQLRLRVAPFDSKLAAALHPDVRTTLFKLGHPDAHPHLARVNFSLGVPRQFMELYATPESPAATMGFDHVKITGVYARTQAGMNNMFVLAFDATFGPVSDKELGFCEAWRKTMKFGNFEEAEASDLFIEEGEDDDDADDTGQQSLPDPDAVPAAESASLNADTDKAASRDRERAHKTHPRHATRHAAAKAKQAKGRGRKR